MKRHLNNNEGLTLIEVIASIVILTIVLISFLNFFLQSTKHTKYNNEKLSSVEVTEEIIADIRSDAPPDSEKYTERTVPSGEKIDNLPVKKIYENKDTFHKDYKITVTFTDGPTDANLDRAIVEVELKADTRQKRSSFKTETYVKRK